jgi:hypothetical protein
MSERSPEGPQSGGQSRELRPDMVWIAGGTFYMGSDRHYPDESPAHRVAEAERLAGVHSHRHLRGARA